MKKCIDGFKSISHLNDINDINGEKGKDLGTTLQLQVQRRKKVLNAKKVDVGNGGSSIGKSFYQYY